jgi:hypothetical protein
MSYKDVKNMWLTKDVLALIITTFLDFSRPSNFAQSCCSLTVLAVVSKQFAQVVGIVAKRLKLSLKLRVCRLFQMQDPMKCRFAFVFPRSAFLWKNLNCPLRAHCPFNLFVDKFVQHAGIDAFEWEVRSAEARTRKRALREEREKRKRIEEDERRVLHHIKQYPIPNDHDHRIEGRKKLYSNDVWDGNDCWDGF